jgi:hypothetical protein
MQMASVSSRICPLRRGSRLEKGSEAVGPRDLVAIEKDATRRRPLHAAPILGSVVFAGVPS